MSLRFVQYPETTFYRFKTISVPNLLGIKGVFVFVNRIIKFSLVNFLYLLASVTISRIAKYPS